MLYPIELPVPPGRLNHAVGRTGRGFLRRESDSPGRVRPGQSRRVDTQFKILDPDRLDAWRGALRSSGRRLVVTNGCFDLLHAGHVAYLEAARSLGDALLVGLNGDASVRALKGAGRPLNPEADRARVLAALACVDAVCVFPEVRAERFLGAAAPDVYVKGGDYTLGTLDPNERAAVEAAGARIAFIPLLAGRSTTGLVAGLQRG